MFSWIVVVLDAASVLLSGFFAWWLILPNTQEPLIYVVLALTGVIFWSVLAPLIGVNQWLKFGSNLDWIVNLLAALAVAALLTVILLWAFKLAEEFSRLWLVAWFSTNFILLVTWRIMFFSLLKQQRMKSGNATKVIIVGAGRLGQSILSKIQESAWIGLTVNAFFDDAAEKVGIAVSQVPVFSAENLSEWLESNEVDEIWFALPLRAEPRLQQLLHELRHTTANIRYVPNLSGLRLLNHAPREVLGFTMLDLSVSPMSEPFNRWIKVLEDKALAGLILLSISPLMLFVALGVKLSSPGPVFYRQERVGLNGKVFDMLKFRSMPVDVEKDGVQWGGAANKTNTRFGAFIRKTSLDELPQFINVLRGDMSIVGPRPERSIFVEQFKDQIPGYMQKHMVKAGITGWAQIHGWRGDTCLKTRIEFDLWYIEHWSLWLDIKIILLTLINGFINKNAR